MYLNLKIIFIMLCLKSHKPHKRTFSSRVRIIVTEPINLMDKEGVPQPFKNQSTRSVLPKLLNQRGEDFQTYPLLRSYWHLVAAEERERERERVTLCGHPKPIWPPLIVPAFSSCIIFTVICIDNYDL